jgi:predicted RNA-binding Zn-ribbon protein involved in translation (DUF1610 family)
MGAGRKVLTKTPPHVILDEQKYASCYCPKCHKSWFSDVKPDDVVGKRCPKCGNTEISYRR